MGIDIIDDALYALRNRGERQVEVMRPCHGDVGDGFVDLEKLQAMRSKLLAQDRGDLQAFHR